MKDRAAHPARASRTPRRQAAEIADRPDERPRVYVAAEEIARERRFLGGLDTIRRLGAFPELEQKIVDAWRWA